MSAKKYTGNDVAHVVDWSPLGMELRLANRKNDRWPGYDIPLGKSGYWAGNHRYHIYLGRGIEAKKIWIRDFLQA